MKKNLLCLGILGAVFLLMTTPVFATLGVDFASPGTTWGWSDYYSLGYKFTANTNFTVNELGTFDYNQDGFGLWGPQHVGLWKADDTLLASTYVSDSDALQGFWRFHPITPVALTAGETYIVASQGGEGYAYYTVGLTVAPEITFVADAYHELSYPHKDPLEFPDLSCPIYASEGGGCFGGNIQIAPVPIPAAPWLLGSGLMSLVGFRRRFFRV